ncbi:hypothetical protein AB0K18_36745 [Nonomuraea sp. NPDC049421]|uniref:hypothetical protein n=1 Tax=Nonomuraea sp. NPDC049421 TaxID=3155275 RepID=UPI00342DBEAF
MSVRRTVLGLAVVAGLAGCGTLPPPVPGLARPSAVAKATSSPATPPPSPSPGPSTPPTPSPSRPALTAAQAGQELRQWLGTYNKTIKKAKWWRKNSTLDALFVEGALHEGVLERNHEDFGQKPEHRPINVQGTPVIYLPRPENQPDNDEWFMAQATYKDVKGHVRAHLLAFLRTGGEPFRLAVVTPVHWGQRVPKPKLDADGYITDIGDDMARAVALEYQNFWNHEKKEGASGYRLAKDSFSRKAFPEVYKGLYVAFRGRSSVYGFRTADGGSLFLFAMLNKPQSVNQVLSEALFVPKGSRTIQELGANWFS